MKRKSEVSTVWNKLSEVSKTELYSEKVELATIKDLDRVTNALNKAKSELNAELQALASMMGKVEARADEASKYAYKVNKMIVAAEATMRELIGQARELGIDPKELKEIKEFTSERDYVVGLIDDLRDLITEAMN